MLASLRKVVTLTKNTPDTHQIGEVSKRLNISIRTIRYYEEIGLLNSVKRVEHGKRVYTDDDIRRLKFIKKLKLLGLSLSDMLELEHIYKIHKTNTKVLPKLINLLDAHGRKIDERISELQVLKKEIYEYRVRMEAKLHDELGKSEGKRRQK